jgi:hypothetical protein
MAANRDPFSTLDPDEIQVAATAEIYSQEVRVRTSYVAEEVIFDARFANILEEEESGSASIDVRRIGEVERVAAGV